MRAATSSGRTPVPYILLSVLAGFVLSIVLAYALAPDGSEGLVTGSALLAWGLGWAAMAWLTIRFSGQPQRWLYVPALGFGGVGAFLAAVQPAAGIMDLLSWIWPVALAVLALWMFRQLRAELRGAGRWIVGALTAVLLLLAIAGAAMTVAAATSAKPLPSTGQLIDMGGGRHMYLDCQGSGGPVVVLQAGAGGDSTGWKTIQSEIAKTTTVCSYDRAGRGRSADPPGPQDGTEIARDLHQLLAKAGIAGPYVFVGHSSGGPYLRVHAPTYADDVAGVVLIDPQPATAFTALPDYPGIYEYLELSGGLAPSLARIGLLGPIFGVGLTEANAAVARSYRDEIRMLPTVLDQADERPGFGSVPLVIVSAGSGSQRGWAEAQDAQVELSTNAVHRTVAAATHDSLLEADSGVSVQAILDVLAAVRAGAPLT